MDLSFKKEQVHFCEMAKEETVVLLFIRSHLLKSNKNV